MLVWRDLNFQGDCQWSLLFNLPAGFRVAADIPLDAMELSQGMPTFTEFRCVALRPHLQIPILKFDNRFCTHLVATGRQSGL